MKKTDTYQVKDWVNDLQKRGRLTFPRQEVAQQFSMKTEIAVRNMLSRLVSKGVIVSIWKGFYVIVPLKYAVRGIVPPELYLDNLMKFLNRPYYVGLLNAASFYGAAHQQPQTLSVLTCAPALRDSVKKGNAISFFVKKKILPSLLKPFKTETGYLQVSTPELTAADLITYQKEVGGLNRVSTVLSELTDSLNFKKVKSDFFENIPVSSIQRLGYLLEVVLQKTDLSNDLFVKARENRCMFQRIPLKYGKIAENENINIKWKVVVNESIDVDIK